ncbi:F-box/LRR-repeat protein 12 [Amblyraja radiata]|uniref:F-box/LRR-repeat protein 12 n=1 Tax=Amblyraja radiata TaxID=386614 RepID=UPI001402B9D7|nr:F-box/LRR-repeat protein 12 [Amblyraja radiata]XP_055519853.1 F-box/LRR-repeat protein 12-like [Leucoraja erinacea]
MLSFTLCLRLKMAAVLGEKAALNSLPENVLVEILSYLSTRDLLRISGVCKRWRRLAYDKGLWKDVNLTPYKVNSRILWHLVRHYLGGTLRTLRVKGVLHSVKKHESLTEALLLEIGKRCPNLSELRLIEMNLRGINYECLPPSLLSLELTHCEIPLHWFRAAAATANGTRMPPQIKNLEVDNVPNFSDQHLQNVASRTALKVLILSGTYRVTDSGIEKSAQCLSEVVHLKLHGCNISDESLRHISQHLTQLRTLDLTNFCSMTDAGLACLGDLRSLQALCFEYCDQITVEKLLAVCTGLPSLAKLNLNGNPYSDGDLQKIRQSLPNCTVTNDFPAMDSMLKF